MRQEAAAEDLDRARAYDTPGIKTENGLATFETAKNAWFKDSDGNTFELSEPLG